VIFEIRSAGRGWSSSNLVSSQNNSEKEEETTLELMSKGKIK